MESQRNQITYVPCVFTNRYKAGSWNFPSDIEGIVEWRTKAMQQGFKWARYGNIITGSYPMGHIGFLMCKKDESKNVSNDIRIHRFNVINSSKSPTTYYHPSLQSR